MSMKISKKKLLVKDFILLFFTSFTEYKFAWYNNISFIIPQE